MKRLAPLVPLFVLVVVLAGCGAVFVGFVSNQGAAFSITGTVTVVQLGFADDGHGTVVSVTLVTLVDPAVTKTLAFCGDQRSHFPINQRLKAEFTGGTLCSTLVTVVFIVSFANADGALFPYPGTDEIRGFPSCQARHALLPSQPWTG